MEKKNDEINMLDMVDGGKSAFAEVTLPTGLLNEDGFLLTSALLTEMTGREEDILSSSRMTAVQKTSAIIENCVEKIGTIDSKDPKFKHYLKTLCLSDRLFLLVQIRIISLGKMFDFKITCPSCGKGSNQAVSLDDFKVSGLLNPAKQAWEGILPRSKKKYKCHVQTGYEEEKQEKMNRNDGDILSLLIMSRLKELDGKSITLDDVKKLPLLDRNHLRAEMKKNEGTIDNEIEVGCPHCQHEFKTEIDIGAPSFFFP